MYNFSVSIDYFYVLYFVSQNFLPSRFFILSYSMWCPKISYIMQSASFFCLLSIYFQFLSSFSTLLFIFILSFWSHTLPSLSSHRPPSCPFLDLHCNIPFSLLYCPSLTTSSLSLAIFITPHIKNNSILVET